MMDTDYMKLDVESIMSEIFTLDNTGSLQSQSISQNTILQASNTFNVGKIYRDDGCSGTGFVVGWKNNGPMILTCKHVALDTFTHDKTKSYICFEEDQSMISFFEDYRYHQCGRFYKLTLIDVASPIDDPRVREADPITGVEYSLPFDAALFQMRNKCKCGNPLPYPNLKCIPLTTMPPSSPIEIYGYLGEININSVPLVDITETELVSLRMHLKKGVITLSRGSVIRYGGLVAISCPTTAGFSGSPVVASYQLNETKAWGLFISGPAVEDHEFLHRLMNAYVRDKALAKDLLRNIDSAKYPYASSIANELRPKIPHNWMFIQTVTSFYNSTIYQYRKTGYKSVLELNHNLCLPLARIQGFLRKNSIQIS